MAAANHCLLIILFFAITSVLYCHGNADKTRLMRNLLFRNNYNQEVIPTGHSRRGPVEVRLGMTLVDILKADKDHNQVEVVAWFSIQWKDYRLQWDPSSYGNVSSLRMSPSALWTPDITVYNLASNMEIMSPKRIVLSNTGDILNVPSYRFRFLCDLSNLGSYRSDVNCSVKLGSWTYSGLDLSLVDPNPAVVDVADYFAGSKYEILDTYAQKNSKTYPCCPEVYEDIVFSFTFRSRRTGFFF